MTEQSVQFITHNLLNSARSHVLANKISFYKSFNFCLINPPNFLLQIIQFFNYIHSILHLKFIQLLPQNQFEPCSVQTNAPNIGIYTPMTNQNHSSSTMMSLCWFSTVYCIQYRHCLLFVFINYVCKLVCENRAVYHRRWRQN